MVLNATGMTTYDTVKTICKKLFPEGMLLQTGCAIVSGFAMAVTVTPFDMIRTRLMNQPKDAKIYSNIFDCVWKILRSEGPTAFYKG